MWLNKAETWKLSDELEVLDYIRTKTLTCYNGIIGMAVVNVQLVIYVNVD